MIGKVQKWGNSLAVRLPKALADEAHIAADSPVEITVEERGILVRPTDQKKKYRLDDLLDQIRAQTLHGETDFGEPVGKELW